MQIKSKNEKLHKKLCFCRHLHAVLDCHTDGKKSIESNKQDTNGVRRKERGGKGREQEIKKKREREKESEREREREREREERECMKVITKRIEMLFT